MSVTASHQPALKRAGVFWQVKQNLMMHQQEQGSPDSYAVHIRTKAISDRVSPLVFRFFKIRHFEKHICA